MAKEAMIDIVIDGMTVHDVPQVTEIERDSFTMPWSEMLFNNEVHNPRSIARVVRHYGMIIGYVCASRILDEGHVLNLAVHSQFRKQGIASRLIKGILKELFDNGCRSIFLEVRASNHAGQAMYEKMGFKVIGVRKDYYISPVEDGIMMAMKIDDQCVRKDIYGI